MSENKAIRLNSEKSLQHKTFKLKLGTTNKNNPLVVYVEGKVFISPNVEKDDYAKDMHAIKFGLQKSIRETLENTQYLQNKYILDFQIANNGIKKNKKSFLTFEFLVNQPADRILKLGEIKKYIEHNIYEIVDALEQNIIKHDFSLSKTKK